MLGPRSRVLVVAPVLILVALAVIAGDTQPVAAAEGRRRSGRISDKEAQSQYKRGEAAFRSGDYDKAYAAFEAGYTLSERPLFLLNMAHTERRRGQLQNARSLYNTYLLMDPRSRERAPVERILREIDGQLTIEAATVQNAITPPHVDALVPSGPPPLPAAAPEVTGPADPPPSRRLASDDPPAHVERRAPPPRLTVVQQRDEEEPPRLRNDEGAFYTRWWFWTGAAVVVGGVVAAGLMARKPSYAREGSIGSLHAP
jgi:hypothetical protein